MRWSSFSVCAIAISTFLTGVTLGAVGTTQLPKIYSRGRTPIGIEQFYEAAQFVCEVTFVGGLISAGVGAYRLKWRRNRDRSPG
jgi:hypothetical protein